MTRKLTHQDYYRMRPDEFEPGDEVFAKVVAVIGYGGDYAVYVGPTDWADIIIAQCGDKVAGERGKQLGEALFPSVAEGRRYRG